MLQWACEGRRHAVGGERRGPLGSGMVCGGSLLRQRKYNFQHGQKRGLYFLMDGREAFTQSRPGVTGREGERADTKEEPEAMPPWGGALSTK